MKYEQALIMSEIMKALAHPVRVMIVNSLAKGDKCVCDLNSLAELDQSNISRHLAQLKRAGIVTEYREGQKIMNHLECPCILKAFECSVEVVRSSSRRKYNLVKGFM